MPKTAAIVRKSTAMKHTGSFRKSKLAEPPFQLFEEDSECEKTFQDGLKAAVNLLKGRKNVVVLCGAGISVSCGIPDFRSKGGIYDMIGTELNMMNNDMGGLCTAEEIFHYEVFQDDPRPFYKFAGKMLFPEKPHTPSPSHRFLSLLEEKKMLLRVYTQNIDGLEEKAGISAKKVVHAHGSLSVSTCLKCGAKVSTEDLRDEVLSGKVPHCKKIKSRRKRRRTEIGVSIDGIPDSDDTIPVTCDGVIKPNITFFGEPLVDKVRRCLEADQAKADAVIVIGTSLSVAPISKVIRYLRPSIPRILINRTVVIPKHADGEDDDREEEEEEEIDHRDGYLFDALLLGFCDEVTKALSYVLKDGGKSKPSKKAEKKKENGKLFPFQSDDCDVLCNDIEALEAVGGDSCLLNHSPDRVLMFPGAKLEAKQEEELTYSEVVHCDECHRIIQGTIMKCVDCFDFDLCKKCHPKVAKTHCGGKHKFVVEKI